MADTQELTQRYVVLYRLTEKGREHARSIVHHASSIKDTNETAGFKVLGVYYTQGQYDMVAIVEAPSEQAMLTGLFSIAGEGNVVSETLRAYTPDEVQASIGPA